MSMTKKEVFEDYKGFVEKFKPKKTTDDCYTPPPVYDAIADWVANEYGVDRASFARPFYPGGDYKNYDYCDKIVVDNPPFSILSEIIKFYVGNNIKFFLFVPTLTSCHYGDYCSVLITDSDIIYENGAKINTSFATNLEPYDVRIKTAPSLYDVVKKANYLCISKIKKNHPKYIYPLNLVTAASLGPYARLGIDFTIPRGESVRVTALDAQRPKTIYGSGLIISERLKIEREKAEREKAERSRAIVWPLSDRERNLIKDLNR